MAEKTLEEIYKEVKAGVEKTSSTTDWNSLGYSDIRKWVLMRKKCCADLFWFATEILGYDLVEFHRFITTEFFFAKDPELPLYKLSPNKSRLILYPRGSFKSSIDEADTVQWIIAYPNIRIALMTATDDLGLGFVAKVKSFFEIPEDTRLTHFQMLFFEHCVPAKRKEAENIFITRARTKKLTQPTLEALSLVATTSGKHYDVGKFDDVVSNKNSGPGSSQDARKTVYDNIRFAAALIDPFGYRFYIGTPYDSDDAWSYIRSKTKNLIFLMRPALIIKDDAKGKHFLDLTDDDVELLFPEDRQGVPRLTLEYLKGEFQAEEYIFNCNYLLDPKRSRAVNFTEELIRSRLLDNAASLPMPGTYKDYSAWDFADSTGKKSDFSVGVVGRLNNFGQLFIMEIIRGRFSPSELAFQVASQAARWKVEKIYIEKSPGADFLQNDILRELNRLNYSECPYPEFFPVDNQKGAKEKRAELLESYFVNKLLWLYGLGIVDKDPKMVETLVEEFVRFKPGTNRKDDIIDAIAHVCRVIPAKVELPKSDLDRAQVVWDILAEKQLQDLYYGVRENSTPQPTSVLSLSKYDGEYGTMPVCCPHCGFSPCIGT